MAHLLDKYRRVTEEHPCPKCGHETWCLVRNDGKTCICQRVSSGMKLGHAGYLHYLPPGEAKPVTAKRSPKVYLTTQQVAAALRGMSKARNREMLDRQARLLGLSYAAIDYMQVHYASKEAAIVFPMFDGNGKVCGARYRRSDGRKWSLKGGREGAFMSRQFSPRYVTFVTEGPTDAAALCDLNLVNVLGRPSCSYGKETIGSLLEHPDTPVIIVSDPKPQEVDGAVNLANYLRNPAVVILGPTDVREFVRNSSSTNACRCAILEGVAGDDTTLWQAIHRNVRGRFYPFDQHYISEAAA